MFRIAETYVVSEKKDTSIRVTAANNHKDNDTGDWWYT
jgi:hypothetical protein